MLVRFAAFGIALAMLGGVAAAAPTPVPGGANQVSAVSAKLGATVFNGNLRITISELRDATPEETAQFRPNADQKVMVMKSLLRNGISSEFIDLVEYTLADKDAVSVSIGNANVTHANLHILQGAATRQVATFAVDKDFVPAKVIVECATCGAHSGFRPVRFTVPASM